MKDKQSLLKQGSIWDMEDKELLNLIIGRDGGKTTIRIIDEILDKPHNKNQLANILDLDYNTITHHIKIIQKHNYISDEQFGKIHYYHPTNKLFKSLNEYKFIKNYLLNNKK
ncbi:MAG: winged helix-turn-helix transcriptional regulator [Methanobrevibacter thaueri]|nr:winged helix-turn-helix transcriptional regulator [Methanobrevibacter thaueri]